MRVATVLMLALLAAGCATEEELAAADAKRCESFGFEPETKEFSQCRLDLYKARTRQHDVVQQPAFYPPPVIVEPRHLPKKK